MYLLEKVMTSGSTENAERPAVTTEIPISQTRAYGHLFRKCDEDGFQMESVKLCTAKMLSESVLSSFRYLFPNRSKKRIGVFCATYFETAFVIFFEVSKSGTEPY
jgi:hypothetical protein